MYALHYPNIERSIPQPYIIYTSTELWRKILRQGIMIIQHDIKHNRVCGSLSWQMYMYLLSLQWRHNGHDGVSNHQRIDCLLKRSFRRRSKKRSKSLAFMRGNHRWPVNFPHKVPVTRKMFPFDEGFMPCTHRVTVSTMTSNRTYYAHFCFAINRSK